MPEISEEELEGLKAKAAAAEDARTKAEALAATNERLLNESKDKKESAGKWKEKAEALEKEKLEKEGNLSALLNKANEEILALKGKDEEKTSKLIREKLRADLGKHAKDAHDLDMVLKVSEHRDLLKIDADNLEVEGTKEFVEKVRETHGYLFAKKSMDPGDNKKPPGDKPSGSSEDQYFSELRACNSRKELEAVRKKYGKIAD